jgi:DUF2945 family protein
VLYTAVELIAADNTMPSFMKKRFKVGDHVAWNSEAGRVSGTIIKVHTKDVDYKGYTHHASRDEPQYEIKSDTTDHIAMHKGAALRRTRRMKG